MTHRKWAPTPASGAESADVESSEVFHLSDDADVLGDLVARAMGTDAGAACRLAMAIQSRGVSPETMFAHLLEPAARRLGDLWEQDLCSQFDVTIALGRLQSLVRRLGSYPRSRYAPPRGRSVFVATVPGLPITLSSTLASYYFLKAGWRVRCDFPKDHAELGLMLHEAKFDVLHLSMSSVFRCPHLLPTMHEAVRVARDSALNPKLIVLASGRIFSDNPELSLLAGADGCCRSAADAESTAETLLSKFSDPACSAAHAALKQVVAPIAAAAFADRLAVA